MQGFHHGATNWETSSKVLCSNMLTRQNLGRYLFEGNKDHLLSHAKSELMRQEHQVGSLTNCIDELQQQAHAQRWELQDAHDGCIVSRREQSRLQEGLSLKERVLRDTQIRSMHEMGEMKMAQELRVHEVSVQNHETIQKAHISVAGNAGLDEFYEGFG